MAEDPRPTRGSVIGGMIYLVHLLNDVPDQQSRRKKCLPMPVRNESKPFRSVGSCTLLRLSPDKLSVQAELNSLTAEEAVSSSVKRELDCSSPTVIDLTLDS